MYKKYGTTGHIEKHEIEHPRPYFQKTKGKRCIYCNSKGKCAKDRYVNKGNDCKYPGRCRKFIPVGGWLS